MVAGWEQGEHMLWTPELEDRIDFVGWWRSVKKLPGKTSKGEPRGPLLMTWDKLLLTFLWRVQRNMWRSSLCMIGKTSALGVNGSNFWFLWPGLSTYTYLLRTCFPSSQGDSSYDWNVSPQNSYVEIRTPKGASIRRWGVGRWLGHEGRISALRREVTQSSLAPAIL